MTVLRNYHDYMDWFSAQYPCDIFTSEELTTFADEEKPQEYPCVVHEFPARRVGHNKEIMFISLNEIETWCHLLRDTKK